MTDSELLERMNEAFRQITEQIESLGALLEMEKKPDFRWSGLARMPSGKLFVHAQKTGKQSAPDSHKAVAEALADLTLEGRFIGRILFFPAKTEIELPGGARRPLDHSGVVKMFSSL
jgi:hypothetical protein